MNRTSTHNFTLLSDICAANNIHMVAYSGAGKLLGELGISEQTQAGGGFAVRIEDTTCIFYDDAKAHWEKKHIIAHELGHVLLGHLAGGNGLSTDYMEAEANAFASAIVAQELFQHYQRARERGAAII